MNDSIRIGDWVLTPATHRLETDETTHVLRAKLVQILVSLAEEPGRVFQRDELLDRIWPGMIVTDDSLTRGISELRKLLDDSAENPRYIETIRKGGYRLIARVARVDASPDASPDANPGATPDLPPDATPAPTTTLAPAGSRRWVSAAVGLLAGSALLVWSPWTGGQPSRAVPTLEPRPFTTLVGRETDPAISPDGTRVAFVWSGADSVGADIYVKSLHGDELMCLTEGPEVELNPAWSPDGERIAFLRIGKNGAGVYVAPAQGGPSERIVETSTWIRGLDWSPDGRALIFSGTEGDSGGMHVRRVSLKERRAVSLSAPPAFYSDHSPVFSPCGSRIACVRSSWTSSGDRIVLLREDGSELATFATGGLSVRGLDWFADEERLILAADVGSSTRLFHMSVHDGKMTEIRVREQRASDPSVASDGSTVIYEDGFPRQLLHRVRLTSTGIPGDVEPIQATTHDDRGVDHSPDGTRLAIVSDRSGVSELWVTGLDGTGARRLTHSGPESLRTPRWAPDGESLAYLQESAEETALWLVSVQGDARRLLAFKSGVILSDWSRDASALYVSAEIEGAWHALRVEVADARTSRVAGAGATVVLESPDGRSLYYSKAREKGIWRKTLGADDSELVIASFDPVYTPSWGTLENGIFYGEWAEGCTRLAFFDFGTLETSILVRAPWRHASGFSLSPSGDELVIALTDRGGSDLNLIEYGAPPHRPESSTRAAVVKGGIID